MKITSKIVTLLAMTLILALGSTQLTATPAAGSCPATACGPTCLIEINPIDTCYSGGFKYVYRAYFCGVTTCYSSENYGAP